MYPIRWAVMLLLNCLLAVASIWCGVLLIGGGFDLSAADMGGLGLIAYGLTIVMPMIFDLLGTP
jgi:hypothetical protein